MKLSQYRPNIWTVFRFTSFSSVLHNLPLSAAIFHLSSSILFSIVSSFTCSRIAEFSLTVLFSTQNVPESISKAILLPNVFLPFRSQLLLCWMSTFYHLTVSSYCFPLVCIHLSSLSSCWDYNSCRQKSLAFVLPPPSSPKLEYFNT